MNKDLADKIALIISAVFTPPLVAAATIALIVDHYPNYTSGWLWGILAILLVIGPASIYILLAYKQGAVHDITLTEREERLRPLTIALLGAVVGTLILLQKEAPSSLVIVGYILISELATIILVTAFWKISVHTLTLSAIITIAMYTVNKELVLLYLFLLPVAWARVHRKKHSVMQVTAGAIVGALVVVTIFYLFSNK